MYIQEGELIVGHPCGKPRTGSFSPDTDWQLISNELDTIGTRSQDPYQISEEDKKILQDEIFPFWKGKSVAEACETEFRKAGIWEFGAESCVSDLTYHISSGGGDTSPGYDIILLKKAWSESRLKQRLILQSWNKLLILIRKGSISTRLPSLPVKVSCFMPSVLQHTQKSWLQRRTSGT